MGKRTLLFSVAYAWVFLVACAGANDPAPVVPAPDASATPPPQGGGPGAGASGAPGAGMPGASAAEDLSSSWDPVLAVAMPRVMTGTNCADADHDGFSDAWTCGGLPAAKADCDDDDPAVTPASERYVPAGPFLMGSNSDHAGADEKPVHVVQLSGFCLDVSEMVDGGKPIEGVTYDDATARCAAEHKSLPTEAQWEKAARGGCEGGSDPLACDAGDLRAYPWGAEAPTCDRANHQQSAGGSPRMCVGATDTVVRNTGPYGNENMAGNVWEWVADRYHPAVYRRDPPRIDPIGPAAGDLHVLRGGGWNTFSTNMRVANRMTSNVEGSAVGVRCARSRVVGNVDAVTPLQTVEVSGTVVGGEGPLAGNALYVTAFAVADADPRTGMVAPGRSPVAETKLRPDGAQAMPFTLLVPVGGDVLVSAALDAGAATMVDGKWMAQSGSGGFGACDQNPVATQAPRSGLTVTIRRQGGGAPPPSGVGAPGGPAGPPNGGGRGPPNGGGLPKP